MGVRYAADMAHRSLPSWWKVAATGTLTSLAWATADLLAGHRASSLVVLNGTVNGLLAALALNPALSTQKKITLPHRAALSCLRSSGDDPAPAIAEGYAEVLGISSVGQTLSYDGF